MKFMSMTSLPAQVIKLIATFFCLMTLVSCGGGGGWGGTPSGTPAALFTTAPGTLALTVGAAEEYTITGGREPYTVNSSSPSTAAAFMVSSNSFRITSLLAGSANVVITDLVGKTISVAVTVANPALFSTAPSSLTLAIGTSSEAYAITGGAPPYTAVSSNTAVATSSTPAANGRFVIQGVSAGSTTVTIKDTAGTSLSVSVTVPAPTALFSTAPAALQILNGTTNFYTVFGGTPPYVVNTAGGIAKAVLSGSSLAITGVVPGTQTVAISDAKGAVITIDVTVNSGLFTDAPANLSVAVGTGVTYSIYGGSPFSGAALYRVNSSKPAVASATVTGSTLSISGVSVGSTSLIISDSVGAATTITVTVPAAGALLTTAPSSLNLATGTSGTYAISGGVAPYVATSANPVLVSASINGSSLTIGAVADTLGGTANVIVSDSAGTPPVTIAVTSAPVQFFTTAPSQLAIASGAAKIFAVFGGSLPYSVVNTNPAVVTGAIASVSTSTTLTITGIMAGSGTVILSDAKGATVSIAVVVNAAVPLNVSAPGGTVFMASGSSSTYDIIGGVPTYLAASSDMAVARATIVNANQIRIDAVGAGKATIAVTDSAGTKVSIDVTVGSSNAFFVAAPSALNMSAGTSAGYQVSGGAWPYTVSSSNLGVVSASVSATALTVNALNAGTATLQVSDTLGANYSITVVVTNATGAFFVAAPASLNMGAGTSTGYSIGGGTKPYAVSSSDLRVATGTINASTSTLTVNALSAGTAILQVSDARGAAYSITVVVDNLGGTGSSAAASVDILASSNTLNSAPGSLINFIVTVKNGANVALPKQTVVFTASSGTLTGANPAPITNDAGTVSTVTLSPGADASNRSITVTATSGSISKNIIISVVGTTVTVSGPGAALVGSAPQSFTVKAADSSGKPIVGASVSITSALGNGISPQTVTTDISGAGTVTFTATQVGTDTLTAAGLGVTGTATVAVSNVDFGFTAPAPAALLPVSTANPVTARYRVAGVGVAGQTVTFSSTRGTLSASTAVTDVNGLATVSVSSTTAGPVTVSAQLGTARSSLTATFVATVPATVVLQANPAAMLPNTLGSTANQSALTAVVRDTIGNPVQGVVVNFNAVTDGSNGSISPGSATTDAGGMATAQFIAGPLSTAANGVQIKATVQSNPAITGTALLTVNGSALFISIARSSTLTVFDSTTYEKAFSVYVTDATGAPAGNRAVTLSADPISYGKGSLVWTAPSGPWIYAAGSPTICVNEDTNRNGILDPGEDINGNGKLDPGSPVVITSSVTTDALGFGAFTLRYGKNFAWWLSTQITAKSLVSGTESKQTQSYDLEMSSGDATNSGAPANVVSPFGIASVCTNPN